MPMNHRSTCGHDISFVFLPSVIKKARRKKGTITYFSILFYRRRTMPPFQGKTFVLELSRDVRFKAKQDLINYLREQNANISYILTASVRWQFENLRLFLPFVFVCLQTDYVLVSNDNDTYKTRRAKQLGIPLLDVEYIHQYRQQTVAARESLDIKRYIVTSAEDKENFAKSGMIPVAGELD